MKKWWYPVLVAVLIGATLFTACAKKEGGAGAATAYEKADPKDAKVLWWHQHTGGREEGLQQMVAEFNSSNEWGIEVTAEYAGGYSEIYDKMITAIAANDPSLMPNLTVGYANQVAKYQLTDSLVDMDEFVDSAKWGLTAEEKADFYQGIFESDVSPVFGDGHFRMGFPPNRSMEVLYYNMDWLRQMGYDGPPETWAEFKEMACKATDPAKGTVGYEVSTDASRFDTRQKFGGAIEPGSQPSTQPLLAKVKYDAHDQRSDHQQQRGRQERRDEHTVEYGVKQHRRGQTG